MLLLSQVKKVVWCKDNVAGVVIVWSWGVEMSGRWLEVLTIRWSMVLRKHNWELKNFVKF